MSRDIDERVVEMRFDNKDFESNVGTSMKTIDKLKQALNFSDAGDSFADIDKAAGNVSLAGISDACETVSGHFSMLEVAAITAMQNITNRAVNMGINMAKSLSVDQISAGFSKYEEKTGAVQTIMAATGLSIEAVNEQLEKLNWFTDETSYNFVDMVNNIGKFTSNNVPLDKSVTAMEGIANWAALSGQNAGSASRAMYNLAQAISVGSVKLMDWKSIENANMATTEFKQTAIDTAVELGTLRKAGDGTYKTLKGTTVTVTDFNSALSEAWFSSDVLLKTLGKYGEYSDEIYKLSDSYDTAADAMEAFNATGANASMVLGEKAFKAAQEAKTFTDAINSVKDAVSTGWMTTFELIFGNYEEAKSMWTSVANELWDVFASGAGIRNGILEEWRRWGGRDYMLEGISNSWAGFKQVLDSVKNTIGGVLRNVFFIDKIRDSFDSIKQSLNFTSLEKENEYWENFNKNGIGYLMAEASKTFAEFSKNFHPENWFGSKANNAVMGAFYDVLRSIALIIKVITTVASSAGKALSHLFDGLSETSTGLGYMVSFVSGSFNDILESLLKSKLIEESFEKLGKVISVVSKTLGTAFETIGTYFREHIGPILYEKFEDGEFIEFFKSLKDPVNAAIDVLSGAANVFGDLLSKLKPDNLKGLNIFTAAFETISKVVSKAWEIIKTVASNIKTKLQETFAGVSDVFGNFNGDASTLLVGGGVLGLALTKIIEVIKNFKIKGKIEELVDTISETIESLGGVFDSLTAKSNSNVFKEFAIAVGILAGSLLVLSFIKPEQLRSAIWGMTFAIGEMIGAIALLDKIDANSKSMTGIGIALVEVAGAILILAFAMKTMADIEPDRLGTAILTIGALMIALGVMSKYLTTDGGLKGLLSSQKSIKGIGTTMIEVAAAIWVLAKAMQSISSIDPDRLGDGLFTVIALIASLTIAMNSLKKVENAASTGFAMIEIATALVIIAQAIKMIGNLDSQTLTYGLTGVSLALFELVVACRALSDQKGVALAGFAMIEIAGAMVILGAALKIMASIDPAGLVTALTLMGVALAEIVLALNFMPKPGQMLSSAAGLILISEAMVILAGALLMMGMMNADQMTSAVTALSISLIVMSAAIIACKKSLAGAASILVISTSLGILASVLLVLSAIPMKKLMGSILGIGAALAVVAAAGMLIGALSEIFLAAGGAMLVFGAGLTVVGIGLGTIGLAIGLLATSLSAGATAIVVGLKIIIESVAKMIPTIATNIGLGIVAICGAIAESAFAISEAVTKVVLALLDAIVALIPAIANAGLQLLVGLLSAINEHIYDVVVLGTSICVNFINGIATSLPDIIDAGFNLILSFINGISMGLAEHSQDIFDALSNLMTSIEIFVLTGLQNIVKDIPLIGNDISESMQGIIDDLQEKMIQTDLTSEGEETIGAYNQGIIHSKPETENATDEITGAVHTSITRSFEQSKKDGAETVESVVAGMTSQDSFGSVFQAGSDVGNKGSEGVDETESAYETSGVYIVQGMINGMNSMTDSVYTAGFNIGNAGVEGINAGADVHSPSRKSYKTGEFIIAGLVNSMRDNGYKAERSGREMATNMLYSINDAFDTVNSLNSSALNPVITPVLDLTEVESGTRQLSSLMNRNSALQASASFEFSNSKEHEMTNLLNVTSKILSAIQNGGDIYLNENLIVGRINRKLGSI